MNYRSNFCDHLTTIKIITFRFLTSIMNKTKKNIHCYTFARLLTHESLLHALCQADGKPLFIISQTDGHNGACVESVSSVEGRPRGGGRRRRLQRSQQRSTTPDNTHKGNYLFFNFFITFYYRSLCL